MAPVDVGNREQVDQVATQLLADLRWVDILMNNAGLNVLGNARRMEHLTPEDWDHVIRVNLTSQYNMFHAVFEPMRAQGDGLVINIISTAAKNPLGRCRHGVSVGEVRDDGARGLADEGGVEVRDPACCRAGRPAAAGARPAPGPDAPSSDAPPTAGRCHRGRHPVAPVLESR
jgi:NAD(P)-dependent dehydrogenase (short-subunit alcohol dehydrogenase family)